MITKTAGIHGFPGGKPIRRVRWNPAVAPVPLPQPAWGRSFSAWDAWRLRPLVRGRASQDRAEDESEVNVDACPEWACHDIDIVEGMKGFRIHSIDQGTNRYANRKDYEDRVCCLDDACEHTGLCLPHSKSPFSCGGKTIRKIKSSVSSDPSSSILGGWSLSEK
jgi:hypothetical protein